jgi:hypothetical protein
MSASERVEILTWLSLTIASSERQQAVASRQVSRTGEWLFHSVEFARWLADKKSTLLCTGKPGAGKTFLTAAVINYLSQRFKKDSKVGIAYIYYNITRPEDEQRPERILASLLRELVQPLPTIPQALKSLYYASRDRRTFPTLDDMRDIFPHIIALYSRVFIVIDALDEQSDTYRDATLSILLQLEISLFATSRAYPGITEIFQDDNVLKITFPEPLGDDIREFIDSRIQDLPSFVKEDPAIQQQIKKVVLTEAGGMYVSSPYVA